MEILVDVPLGVADRAERCAATVEVIYIERPRADSGVFVVVTVTRPLERS
jgi:hypothetical protein